jgi:hypothetical protein
LPPIERDASMSQTMDARGLAVAQPVVLTKKASEQQGGMEKQQYSVVLFYSTSSALQVEKLLKGMGIVVKLIPVPRQLSSDCGISLRFDRPDESRIRTILENKQIETQGIHPI